MTMLTVNDEDSAILAWKFLTDPELFSWKQLLVKGPLHRTEADDPEYVRLKEKCTVGASAEIPEEVGAHVFCDVHRSPMLTSGVAGQTELWPFPGLRCQSQGCKRHFVESLGYFDISSNTMDIPVRRVMHCPAHVGSMAITAIHASMLFWHCVHSGCEASIPRFTQT
jgi:hypothetical protein